MKCPAPCFLEHAKKTHLPRHVQNNCLALNLGQTRLNLAGTRSFARTAALRSWRLFAFSHEVRTSVIGVLTHFGRCVAAQWGRTVIGESEFIFTYRVDIRASQTDPKFLSKHSSLLPVYCQVYGDHIQIANILVIRYFVWFGRKWVDSRILIFCVNTTFVRYLFRVVCFFFTYFVFYFTIKSANCL